MKNFFSKENNRLVFILVTMFLNFLGFSIIIPILPFLVGQYSFSSQEIALNVGLMLSVYALCQFFAAPALGALSDTYGRRPILLLSLLGSVVGYIIMGIGGALWVLFLGRVIDGLTGGNISTVYAYVADITVPRERGKIFGLLGAAGGFGFMAGPALGGLLARISLSTPLYVAAGITIINMIWGYFVLKESLTKDHTQENFNFAHLNPFKQFGHIFSVRILVWLFSSAFLLFLALSAMFGNTSVFMKDVFNWDPAKIGLLLFTVGVVDVISQGYLSRILLAKIGETKTAMVGLVLCVIGFILAATSVFHSSTIIFYLGVIVLNIGDGIFEPSMNALVSGSVDQKMQGRVQGSYQGIQSIARVIGPLVSAWLYMYWRGLPYVSEGILTILALTFLYSKRKLFYPKVGELENMVPETK